MIFVTNLQMLDSVKLGLASFTELVKVREGNLVLKLPSVQFPRNFYQVISGTKYE